MELRTSLALQLSRLVLGAGVGLVLLLILGISPVPSPQETKQPAGPGSDLEQDTERPPIHKRIDEPSVAACGGCHLEAYQEWKRSLHGRAWTNANVQQASRGFEKKSCRKCHSPMPVLLSGLDRVPNYRNYNQEDGVHCLSCHGLEDGVAATRDLPDAPCKPRFDPRLQQASLCYPCHEPTHGAFEEYERSDARVLGLTCANCHMQVRESGKGHSHGDNGGMNPEFVSRGLGWQVTHEGAQVELTLRNRTGHRFPGEIPSRSLLIWTQLNQEPPQLLTLRKPRKQEQREDNRLEPDEVRKLSFQVPGSDDEFVLRIFFRPLPLMPLERCFLLGEWSLER